MMTRKFSELRPMLTHTPPSKWHQLTFDCPTCPGERIVIHVSLDGIPKGGEHVWGITLPNNLSWDSVTVSPSIGNEGLNRHGRGKKCTAHVTVTDGVVMP
jgi:hypothetical protein